jgi:uncharacterized protein (TIGR04255 family)
MSTEARLPLTHPPIIEAVVDIDCDLSPLVPFAEVEEKARVALKDRYPVAERRFEYEYEVHPAELKQETRMAVVAYQHLTSDRRQLVQVRRSGYSFNRLAPYTSLDDYVPEIERTWRLFVDLLRPIAIRRIGLRYINRIAIPLNDGEVADLREYVSSYAALHAESELELATFLNQYSASEPTTGHDVSVTMTGDIRGANAAMPLLFDIAANHELSGDPPVWDNIKATILSLRRLKNDIFWSSLSDKCLTLFR